MRRLVLVLLAVLGGCFRYAPPPDGLDQVKRGTVVRARFVEEEVIRLRDVTAHNVIGLEGEFVREDNSDLVVSAFWLDSSVRQAGFPGEGWTVRFPLSNIASIEVRRLDLLRTALAVAGVFMGSYLVWDALGGGEGRGAHHPGGGSQTR